MIASISDVHIKRPEDESYHLMLSFLDHKETKQSQIVLLLGDIFDLFVGGDQKFINEYSEIFERIDKLLADGKIVYYIEGNHDFHIGKILNKRFPTSQFKFSTKRKFLNAFGKKVMICHGDDIEIENISYKVYSKFIKSLPIRILAEAVVPFRITKSIGEWASGRSRKKNLKQYESQCEKIKDKFRRSAEKERKNHEFDILIAGHSHVKDSYHSKNNFLYLNNGYAPKEKTFLFLTEEEQLFIDLSDSSR